jgi:hypothetical protein
MNNTCLNDYLGIIDRTVAFIQIDDSIVEFKTFSDKVTIDKHRLCLGKKNMATILEQRDNAAKLKTDFYTHMKPIIPILDELLSRFKMKYGLLTHDRLEIIDTNGHPHSLHEMPVKIKEIISGYLEVQRDSIIDFKNKITPKEITSQPSMDEKVENTIPAIKPENEKPKSDSVKNYSSIEKAIGEKLLDTQDVCEILKYSPRGLQNLRKKGILPYIKIGNKILYKASDVKEVSDNYYHSSKPK